MLPFCFMKDWESLAILSKIKTVVFALVTLLIILKAAFDEKIQSKAISFDAFLGTQKTWFSLDVVHSFGTFAFGVLFADTYECIYILSHRRC